jgi:hypothetical protein
MTIDDDIAEPNAFPSCAAGETRRIPDRTRRP